MKLLFTIAAVFNIQGRGTVIVSNQGQDNYDFYLGSRGGKILLVSPTGNTVRTQAYQESFTPNNNGVVGLCLPDLSKDAITIGSHVYYEEN